MKTPTRASRGGDKTRRKILSAALRLFSKNGFHGTSIRGLARAVGLTEASIYYHFRSKRAIIRTLYEERGIINAIDELWRLPGEVSLERQLAANAVASAHVWGNNSDFLRVLIVEVLRGDKAAQPVHQETIGRWRSGIAELLSRYQSKDEIDRSADVQGLAEAWVNMLYGTFIDRLLVTGRSARGSEFFTPDFRRELEFLGSTFARSVPTGGANNEAMQQNEKEGQ